MTITVVSNGNGRGRTWISRRFRISNFSGSAPGRAGAAHRGSERWAGILTILRQNFFFGRGLFTRFFNK